MIQKVTIQRDRGGNVAELSDETLMAFADGALDAVERRRVADILVDRPDLREKVRAFERTSLPIQRAYDGIFEAPVPANLIEMVRRMPIGAAPVPVADLAAARQARKVQSAHRSGHAAAGAGRRLSWQATAMAASLCLVLGAGAGWYSRSLGDSSSGQDLSAKLMQVALESIAGGSEAVMPLELERQRAGPACSHIPGSGSTLLPPIPDQRRCRAGG